MTLDPSWIKLDPFEGRGPWRLNCYCGPGRTLKVNREGDKLLAYCFREKQGGVHTTERSLAEKLADLRRARAEDDLIRVAPPHPRLHDPSDWPPAAAAWLYKAGLSREDIGEMGGYYHPPTDRVVLPVYGLDGGIIWYQARSINRKPKYLSPPKPAEGLMTGYRLHEARRSGIVLTEDLLSAYKVQKYAHVGTIPLLGTSVPTTVLAYLVGAEAPVLIWLDPDKWGRRGATHAFRQLQAVGVRARIVHTDTDPKLKSSREIFELVRKHMEELGL